MHMTLARELAPQVRYPGLNAEAGAYYLGATTPDIRVLTRWDRARTHFFDLNNYDEQSGVASIFREHPELAAPAQLNKATVAFLCGYISHLEMDEAWIVDVYRPCFGERSPLGGDLVANLLDRVLQFELDRRERQDRKALAEIRDHLLATAVDAIDCFIDREALARWQEINADLLCRQPDWDRFGASVSRHLRPFGVQSEADLAHFLGNIPELIDQGVREVTQERLDAFLERSRSRALAAMQTYVS